MRLPPIVLMIALAAIPCTAQDQAPAAAVPSAENADAKLVAPEVADAEAAIVKSDWKTAESKLSAYLAAHPEDARALFDAGYAADALNQLDQAAGFYLRAVKVDPKSFEAQLSLGLLLARQGKQKEAKPALETATKLEAGEAGAVAKARAWRALAQIDRADDPTKASDDLLEALKLTPETPRDTLLAAELATAANQPDAAEAAYRRVLAKDPANLEAEAGLAHVLIAKKQYAEAETFARKALEQSPEDPALTAQLATALVAQDKAEALPLLQKLHEAHPQDENITRMLADVTAQSGDAAGSDKLYAPLLAAHPADAELQVAHGQNLIRQLKFAEAFEVFTRATQLAPTDPDGWTGLAFAASKTGQHSVALQALTARSKYLPDNPSTYFLWATSYDMLHDRNSAIAYYHHFLEASAGKFPDQEWQARQRLLLLEKKR
ncbi:tetratricopeptide repeat protein [Occallatibacter riparius]|uniref:Tetratricopeptide repeat protein n=1 Tax=Occallatibacter riparius TaxID=1002689 RepID=A0A9J7BRB0_9BACT|nr:tetratricopeptide repeat protein [Occallatibacter riparius]UWZ83462.1 tetratricopeptide repeat protein [Occallatibacter riparius]